MLLVIACGNSLRQDDSAGLRLAEGLVAAWHTAVLPVRLITVQQLLPELALEMTAPDVTAVLFVDTRVAQNDSDTVVEYCPLEPTPPSSSLGHTMTPETVYFYAHELFGFSTTIPVFQLTIPGFAFNHGDQLSSAAQEILTLFLKDSHQILKNLMTILR